MENNQPNFEVAQNIRLTKTNRLDKRTETSKANAEKARLKKLEKLAEKRKMIQIQVESETDSDYDSESSESDSENVYERKVKNDRAPAPVEKKRGRGRPTKEEEKQHRDYINAITDATLRAVKLQEEDRKAVAKAKREAVRMAKASGTYVNKGRGRPFKPTLEKKPEPTPEKPRFSECFGKSGGELVERKEVVKPEPVEKKETAKTEPRGAFVFC